jgi:hypothetical protein
MIWERDAYGLLARNFGSKAFEAGEAAVLLGDAKNYSRGTIYRILHDLVENGKIERIGRGLYYCIEDNPGSNTRIIVDSGNPSSSYARSRPSVYLSETDNVAKKALERLGVPFMLTGPSLLSNYIHHFPRKMIHLFYVTKGAGESAKEALKEARLRALLKPSRAELNLALEEFSEPDIFVIRERSDLRGVTPEGVAEFERALVDTYHETSRGRISFPPEEFGRMTADILSDSSIDLTRTLMLAARRGVKSELCTVIDEAIPDVELKRSPLTESENEKIASVIAGIRSKAR